MPETEIVCWGEAFSPREMLDVPTVIALEGARPIGETAMLGGNGHWDPSCLARSGCTNEPQSIAPCDHVALERDVADVLASTDVLRGSVVSIRGLLGVGRESLTAMGCQQGCCCNQSTAEIVLEASPTDGGSATTISLARFFCAGDESALCCNAPAYGQPVVATGLLVDAPGFDAWTGSSGLALMDVALCESD